MKVTITVIRSLYVFLLVFTLNSCKVHREVQKQSYRVDSTATSSKEVATGSTLIQQSQNSKFDSTRTNGQNKYQRQTVTYNFTPDTGAKKANGLQNRLTAITVTTEQGTQAVETASLTRQNSDGLSMAKDTLTSGEKKSSAVSIAQEARQSETTRTGFYFPWWLILLIIALIVLAVLKGRPIIALIRWIRKVIKDGMPPNSPA